MHFKETDLPGIGRKYWLHTRSGEHLVIVIHNDERRDLFHMESGDSPEELGDMVSLVTLDDDEARAVAAIVGGMTYKPTFQDEREVMLEGLLIEWLRIEPHSESIGRTIGELNIRQATGAVILAVVEKNRTKQFNPGPDYIFTAGATVVVAGERDQIKLLKQLLSNGRL
ncbi:cation:proton antiporter regulatory subunit [Paenibacillus taichungensis]|uniref:Cation:proton antiporter regulatory subunit n=1 Tax=Paenibacillus taichungensis TaxID=484184 RepID=A0ABX2MU17_9BACL|nr:MULTISPECIES: cation:proton antiporter regulatory subunit [Paenibacillus]OME84447.1 potassium:proton antiporter [Paenibacillus pabuli]MEC0108621.1 cation:proton antiporter regulatory subunit [Paenibacillus taichungensis]MEC0196121.1 cation:proton antiporter regulatory subunit [Paenibacillus taichungensis]NEU64744.1 cation:proton antiporter regulatory subunit [Paenibacillus sp. ALJ109b]NUU57599.1 cation:proton antiporter regulatory subunit [Paenibacillus taichungensis]